jgi:hypothetical protein
VPAVGKEDVQMESRGPIVVGGERTVGAQRVDQRAPERAKNRRQRLAVVGVGSFEPDVVVHTLWVACAFRGDERKQRRHAVRPRARITGIEQRVRTVTDE